MASIQAATEREAQALCDAYLDPNFSKKMFGYMKSFGKKKIKAKM